MSKRIVYVDVDLTKKQREGLKAIKPVVQAAMDKAALDQTLAAGKVLVDAERQQADELLASARNAFPELRRRASAARPPVLSVASAHRAVRRPPDQSGLLSGPAPFPAGLNVGD